MPKLRYKTNNWKQYNQSLINRGSLTFWIDGEVLPSLLKQTRRSILEVSGYGAYDTRACHAAIKIKQAVALIPQEKGQPSGSVVILEISPWVARSYTAQISIGKSGMDTTDVHYQKQRCIEINTY